MESTDSQPTELRLFAIGWNCAFLGVPPDSIKRAVEQRCPSPSSWYDLWEAHAGWSGFYHRVGLLRRGLLA